jgi:hypothetical protein
MEATKKVLDEVIPSIAGLGWEGSRTDPGAGKTYSLEWGHVPEKFLVQIGILFDGTLDLIEKFELDPCISIEVVNNFIRINHGRIPVAASYRVKLKEMISARVARIAKICKGDPGAIHKLKQAIESSKIKFEVAQNLDFDALFPIEQRRQDYKKQYAVHVGAIDALVEKWKDRAAVSVCEQIVSLVRSAEKAKITYPDHSNLLCQKLARIVPEPSVWVDILIEKKARPGLLEPFLREAVERSVPEFQNILLRAFNEEVYRWSVLEIIVGISNPTEPLRSLLQDHLTGRHKLLVEMAAYRETASAEIRRLILCHKDQLVAGGFALALWNNRDSCPIEPEIKDLWRTAVLNYSGDEFRILDVLTANKSLAKDWVMQRIVRKSEMDYREFSILEKVVSTLKNEDSVGLIKIIPNKARYRKLVRKLVRSDVALFEQLLLDDNKSEIHLAPLGFPVGNQWALLVIKAAEFGHTVEDMANASFTTEGIVYGKRSQRWTGKLQSFAQLEGHENTTVRKVIELMKKIAEERLKYDKRDEEDEAIYGR